jgi:hypothetical protein
MRILYVGRNLGTSGHRAAALARIGHEITFLDPYTMVSVNRAVAKWNRFTGGLGVVELVRRRLMRAVVNSAGNFDLAWIDHGAIVSAGLVRDLKARIPKVICYSTDDPFGTRDRGLWREFLNAVPSYDLLVVVRQPNVDEAYACGARKVMRVYMSADEVAHAPRQLTDAERAEWQSEVVFVGTAFPERGPFLAELVRLGVPLALYGNRYQRLPEWPVLKPHWRPVEAESRDRYANAISAAKVCLGLLSKGNRDLHTTRSMEIPSLGGVLCAERTSEHLALYKEDREAVFWSSPDECAAKCFALLADEAWRKSIAAAGRQRYLGNPWRNNQVVQDILEAATAPGGAEIGGYAGSGRTNR